jgi:cbb3-type cytochrome oxidase subunit 3
VIDVAVGIVAVMGLLALALLFVAVLLDLLRKS